MSTTDTPQAQEQSAPQALPFDIRTFGIGLWRRRRLLIFCLLLSGAAGIVAGLMMGQQTFEAQTVLLYKPSGDTREEDRPSLFTLLSMVKLKSNLMETRERLHLAASLGAIGAAVIVEIQRQTTLMSIRVQWSNAEDAAAIANTIRDVFIENQRRVRSEKAGVEIRDSEAQLAEIKRTLKLAEDALQAYSISNRIIDLSKEAQWYLEQLTTLDVQYERTRAQKNTIDLQFANVASIISNLRVRVQQESQSQGQLGDVTETNVKIQRFREMISEDKLARENLALMTKTKLELDRMEHLLKIGAVAQTQYDEALAEYEKYKARTLDTQQIKDWKGEVEKLNEIVVPANVGTTPSGDLLKSMMMREFDIQLQQVGLTEEVERLRESVQRAKEKLEQLPKFQRQYASFQREVETQETKKKEVETLLNAARRQQEAGAIEFAIVSEATPQARASKSTRKKITLAIMGAGMLLSVLLLVGLELMNFTIKSAGELALRVPYPVLNVLPRRQNTARILPGVRESVFIEEFRTMALTVRRMLPGKGARLMLVGARHGEGVTTVTANLAACLGRLDERVMVLDAQVREDSDQRKSHTHADLRLLLSAPEQATRGLGEYLSFAAMDVNEISSSTVLPGVECIPRVGKAIIPDLLKSHRMSELLQELSQRFSIVLVDTPPVNIYVDAQNLVSNVDGIIFVVRAQQDTYFAVRKAIQKLVEFGTPIIGTVLINVDPIYMAH